MMKVQTPTKYTMIHQGPVLKLPKPNNKTIKKKNLPAHCRNEETMDVFKSSIKDIC